MEKRRYFVITKGYFDKYKPGDAKKAFEKLWNDATIYSKDEIRRKKDANK